MPASQAAVKAGYSPKHARYSGYQAKQGLRDRLEKALHEAGLTPEGVIHKYLLPALSAERTEYAKFEGQITASVQEINWTARLRAIEIVAEMAGYNYEAERVGRFGETDNDVPQIIDVTIRRKAEELPPARVEVS